MIKVDNADHEGQRRALITDGVFVNVSATEKEVDDLINQLITWRNQDTPHAPVGSPDLVRVYDTACEAWPFEANKHHAGLVAVADEGVRRYAARHPFIDVVFDGPPSHESGRFVEVEDPEGKSVSAGQWIDRGDGMWALRLPRLITSPGEAVVDETFLRRAKDSMKHGPGGAGGRGDCSPDCSKCLTEKLYESIRTTAKAGDSYKFDNQTLKVARVTGTGPEDLVFFEDGTHGKQKHLNRSMRT
jgi:hypothetical protein